MRDWVDGKNLLRIARVGDDEAEEPSSRCFAFLLLKVFLEMLYELCSCIGKTAMSLTGENKDGLRESLVALYLYGDSLSIDEVMQVPLRSRMHGKSRFAASHHELPFVHNNSRAQELTREDRNDLVQQF